MCSNLSQFCGRGCAQCKDRLVSTIFRFSAFGVAYVISFTVCLIVRSLSLFAWLSSYVAVVSVQVAAGSARDFYSECFFQYLLRDVYMHSAVLAVERWLAGWLDVTRRYCV